MKSPLLTALLAIALVVEVVAHLALIGGLIAQKPQGHGFARRLARGLAALAMPPLVPIWGWQAGMRLRVVVWTVALVTYAIGVALAA